MQARAGILTSVYALRAVAATKEENLQIGRRKEQQADCFSGMFTRAVSRSLGIKQSELDQIEAVLAALFPHPSRKLSADCCAPPLLLQSADGFSPQAGCAQVTASTDSR